MYDEEDEYIRNMAIARIRKTRENPTDNIRTFVIPKIDFTADIYYKMIDYNDDWLEPRLTMDIPSYKLRLSYCFDEYPCHSQSVERFIRLVSETSIMYSNPDDRDGRIKATIQAKLN